MSYDYDWFKGGEEQEVLFFQRNKTIYPIKLYELSEEDFVVDFQSCEDWCDWCSLKGTCGPQFAYDFSCWLESNKGKWAFFILQWGVEFHRISVATKPDILDHLMKFGGSILENWVGRQIKNASLEIIENLRTKLQTSVKVLTDGHCYGCPSRFMCPFKLGWKICVNPKHRTFSMEQAGIIVDKTLERFTDTFWFPVKRWCPGVGTSWAYIPPMQYKANLIMVNKENYEESQLFPIFSSLAKIYLQQKGALVSYDEYLEKTNFVERCEPAEELFWPDFSGKQPKVVDLLKRGFRHYMERSLVPKSKLKFFKTTLGLERRLKSRYKNDYTIHLLDVLACNPYANRLDNHTIGAMLQRYMPKAASKYGLKYVK